MDPYRDPAFVPCEHPKVKVAFDYDRVKGMSATEVRKIYPRFDGICPDCHVRVIVYASRLHYYAGDW